MSAFVGTQQLAEQGIHSPKDLLPFPWEKEKVVITEDEQQELLKEIEAFNNANKGKPQQ